MIDPSSPEVAARASPGSNFGAEQWNWSAHAGQQAARFRAQVSNSRRAAARAKLMAGLPSFKSWLSPAARFFSPPARSGRIICARRRRRRRISRNWPAGDRPGPATAPTAAPGGRFTATPELSRLVSQVEIDNQNVAAALAAYEQARAMIRESQASLLPRCRRNLSRHPLRRRLASRPRVRAPSHRPRSTGPMPGPSSIRRGR